MVEKGASDLAKTGAMMQLDVATLFDSVTDRWGQHVLFGQRQGFIAKDGRGNLGASEQPTIVFGVDINQFPDHITTISPLFVFHISPRQGTSAS
jgi:hypothetical protein